MVPLLDVRGGTGVSALNGAALRWRRSRSAHDQVFFVWWNRRFDYKRDEHPLSAQRESKESYNHFYEIHITAECEGIPFDWIPGLRHANC